MELDLLQAQSLMINILMQKNKLLDFIKTLDELDDIQKAKLAQEFITSYSMANSFEQFVSYMKNGGIK